MYQNNSFFINNSSNSDIIHFNIISAFKILTDNSYYHLCDEEENSNYPDKTIAFIRCIEGKGEIYLSDSKITINKDECIFINFHSIKEYKSSSDVWGYRWVNFETKNTGNAFELNKIYKIAYSENEDKAFNKLLTYGQANLTNQNYINSLFLSYFYTVMIENQMDEENDLSNQNSRLIDEMCSFVHQKLYSKISINDIAVFFKISPRRLHQIFTEQLDISPKKYILKKKMEEGYKLIVQTSIPISKIAYMLCFSSPYHFTNAFKKTFSQSPSDVRKMEQIYNNKKPAK